MKKQILYIHGGEAFSNYDNYLEHLRTIPIDDPLNEAPPRKKWKMWLKEKLQDTHEMYMPSMPSPGNAKYNEWKIWFERYFEFLREDVILIGHSQGGYFLAKYLSENTMPAKVKAVYLLAAPFCREDSGGEDGGDFEFEPNNLHKLEEQCEKVFIYHSKDDFVVPYEHGLKFKEKLPEAVFVTFNDKNHFLDEELPEILDSIHELRM